MNPDWDITPPEWPSLAPPGISSPHRKSPSCSAIAWRARLPTYYILDLSADLRQRQQQYLQRQLSAELFHKIEWLCQLPRDFDGIVLANEVLDAMPVHILHKQADWVELGVGYQEQGFYWQPVAAGTAALAAMHAIAGEIHKANDPDRARALRSQPSGTGEHDEGGTRGRRAATA